MCYGENMKLSLKEDVVSLTDFARKTRAHTRGLAKSGRPRVLTHNGRAAMVVMSVEAYERLAAEAEEHRLDLKLREAVAAYAKGDLGQPADKVFARLRKRAAKRQAAVSA
jgi:PHD/YefM family antitoxin component YafN of YafNO toxin-antitoxin module